MRIPLLARVLAALLVVALAGACGDDGEAPAATTSGAPATTTAGPGTTVLGPTGGDVACARLAERYVRQARGLFTHEGTPSDALVERVQARLLGFDEIAGAAGCGDSYRLGVCEGLDALSADGVLVLLPLLPPNGCSG